MVRAPCCEKMGLKKGPWTVEEDEILVSYINRNGHGNWRALPKQAGLLRCGKSCRLRWTNYLRPDIKRGNFTLQEEETIIKLHEELGNRWSAIAARLPGRTDNEIKNVWHTYLKKRMVNTSNPNPNSSQQTKRTRRSTTNTTKRANPVVTHRFANAEPESSPESCISTDQTSPYVYQINYEVDEFIGDIPEIDESFWSEPLSVEEESQETNGNSRAGHVVDDEGDDMGFWLRVLMEAGSSSTQLPSF